MGEIESADGVVEGVLDGVGIDGVARVNGPAGTARQGQEDEAAQGRRHPAFRLLADLYRRQHDCPKTLDALDPSYPEECQDCAVAAARTVCVLARTGWLVAEDDFVYAAVVDKTAYGGQLEVAAVRATLDRAESDGAILAITDVYPVQVMRMHAGRDGGTWKTMPPQTVQPRVAL